MKVMSPTRRKCLAVTSLQTSSLAWPLLPIRFSLYHHLCIHIFSFVYIYILTNYDLGIRSFLLSYCRFYKKKSALLSIFLQIMIWVLCYNFPSLFGWAVLISCWKKKRCKLIIIFFLSNWFLWVPRIMLFLWIYFVVMGYYIWKACFLLPLFLVFLILSFWPFLA